MVQTRSQLAAHKQMKRTGIDLIGWSIVACIALITHISTFTETYPFGKSYGAIAFSLVFFFMPPTPSRITSLLYVCAIYMLALLSHV